MSCNYSYHHRHQTWRNDTSALHIRGLGGGKRVAIDDGWMIMYGMSFSPGMQKNLQKEGNRM